MHPHEPASVAVSPCGSAGPAHGPSRTVVWVRGDHDRATSAQLLSTLVQAAHLDDADLTVDLTVDLSGVTFMDASTISAIVDARNRLGACSRSLSVRAPSRLVRRLFAVCGLEFLIEEHRGQPHSRDVSSLNSWVAVPGQPRAPS